jgi:hypothetical protein
MSNKDYDPTADVLVLSADCIGGLIAPGTLINHITLTKIYGDGKVVFVDPSVGPSEIREGHLEGRKISKLFALLRTKGFFNLEESYFKQGPTDLGSCVVTAAQRDEPEKHVGCYGGALSAPAGFMDCYQALLYPQLQPDDVKIYVRQPISDLDLTAGSYFGFEYQKKLNTPRDWVWIDAGRSSQWRRPEKVAEGVTLDSGYMIPPIDGCRHVRVHYAGDPTAAGATVQLDRNAMSPDAFGDIGITTLMYCAPRPATFALLQSEPNKRLYSVAVTGYSGSALRLVLMGDVVHPSRGRLLVMDAQNGIQNIHPLQPLPPS